MHKRIRPILEKILKGKMVRHTHHPSNHPERSRRIVIVGIGNIMRRDDGFGPRLINRIKDKINALCIDAGTAPENYLGSITKEKPDTILLIDTMHIEKKPGEYDIFSKTDIARGGFTTHNISPTMLMEYLEKEADADIYLLGVQPQNIFFGEELSGRVKRTLDEVSKFIIKLLPDTKNEIRDTNNKILNIR